MSLCGLVIAVAVEHGEGAADLIWEVIYVIVIPAEVMEEAGWFYQLLVQSPGYAGFEKWTVSSYKDGPLYFLMKAVSNVFVVDIPTLDGLFPPI